MDRISPLDSAFLQVEDAHSSLHIASVGLFEGPVPPQQEVLDAIGRRLPRVPRLRQRLVPVPLSLGLPVWAEDPEFDLHQHVRRLSLPAPGGTEELHEVVDQILTEHLDLDRPLWEDVVIEGLSDGRWALVTKVHHTMADGIAGTDLLTTILDGTEDGPAEVNRVTPRLPTAGELVAQALRDRASKRVRELRSVPSAAGRALLHPQRLAKSALHTGRGLLGFARAAVPTSVSSLVGPLGRDRCFRWTALELAEVLEVHRAAGGTVNDLVLSLVAGAFRDLLLARGEGADPAAVRCLVPVSVRAQDGSGALDNQVSALLATLPVELADPAERLTEMAVRMHALKASQEAVAGQWLTSAADEVPPAALTSFLHLAFRSPHRNLTTVVTNVPGPRTRLSLAGRAMLATYPYVPIADRLRIGVAVTTYQDRLLVGVTADRDSTPDVDRFVHALAEGLGELRKAVQT